MISIRLIDRANILPGRSKCRRTEGERENNGAIGQLATSRLQNSYMIAWNSNRFNVTLKGGGGEYCTPSTGNQPPEIRASREAASQDGSDHHGIRDRLGKTRTRDGHADGWENCLSRGKREW